MLVEKLYKLQEEGFFDKSDSLKIDLLLQSINDWPHKVETVQDFLHQIKLFLNSDIITESAIENALNKLSPSSHSWAIESLTSLLELIKGAQGEQLSKVLLQCKAIE